MDRIRRLERYKDERDNEIIYDGDSETVVDIRIKGGSNNKLIIAADANIGDLLVVFTGSNAVIDIASTTVKRSPLRFELRAGHDSLISIGSNVGCAGRAFISAVEGVEVTIGADVMFSRSNELRADDSHPIYDVPSGRRVNVSRSIHIGEHVWLAKHAAIMGGVDVGNGSVVGFRSILTKSIPNNCVAVGAPAKVVRRNIAWERPEVVHRKPGEKQPRPGEKSVKYWNRTMDSSLPVLRPTPGPATRALRKLRGARVVQPLVDRYRRRRTAPGGSR